mmetsp:Transcript_27379/g.49362  ORF Transcript_27379/g.49362 Transcript_27379/m.49362 type:complete len:223 (+) Transcript_27379:2059-2727(+)
MFQLTHTKINRHLTILNRDLTPPLHSLFGSVGIGECNKGKSTMAGHYILLKFGVVRLFIFVFVGKIRDQGEIDRGNRSKIGFHGGFNVFFVGVEAQVADDDAGCTFAFGFCLEIVFFGGRSDYGCILGGGWWLWTILATCSSSPFLLRRGILRRRCSRSGSIHGPFGMNLILNPIHYHDLATTVLLSFGLFVNGICRTLGIVFVHKSYETVALRSTINDDAV